MSMNSNKLEEIQAKFKTLSEESSGEEFTEHDSLMLMAAYLSEFEKIQKHRQIQRNELAKEVELSASYLTQVFRGNKPLNFPTISKLRRALKIRFEVSAKPINELSYEITTGYTTSALVISGNFTHGRPSESHPYNSKVGSLHNLQEQTGA